MTTSLFNTRGAPVAAVLSIALVAGNASTFGSVATLIFFCAGAVGLRAGAAVGCTGILAAAFTAGASAAGFVAAGIATAAFTTGTSAVGLAAVDVATAAFATCAGAGRRRPTDHPDEAVC